MRLLSALGLIQQLVGLTIDIDRLARRRRRFRAFERGTIPAGAEEVGTILRAAVH